MLCKFLDGILHFLIQCKARIGSSQIVREEDFLHVRPHGKIVIRVVLESIKVTKLLVLRCVIPLCIKLLKENAGHRCNAWVVRQHHIVETHCHIIPDEELQIGLVDVILQIFVVILQVVERQRLAAFLSADADKGLEHSRTRNHILKVGSRHTRKHVVVVFFQFFEFADKSRVPVTKLFQTVAEADIELVGGQVFFKRPDL